MLSMSIMACGGGLAVLCGPFQRPVRCFGVDEFCGDVRERFMLTLLSLPLSYECGMLLCQALRGAMFWELLLCVRVKNGVLSLPAEPALEFSLKLIFGALLYLWTVVPSL